MVDFESAKDKVMMGAERRSMVMTEEEKRLTAYHEAGHALVGYFSPASDPIHKATIIPRGRALGMVMRLPEGDRISVSREKLNADIAVAMGGRVAEEVIFGYDKVTAGAASDIEQATKIARHMVTQWGMSDKLGPMAYGENQQEVFLGHSITQSQNVSEATARLIDGEIRRIVDEGYSGAQQIISSNLDRLHDLANALLEHETLTGDEVGAVLRGDPMPKAAPQEAASSSTAASGGRRGSVPTTAPPKDDAGGMEPSPQPGA
jgi:cell division protease FtsH